MKEVEQFKSVYGVCGSKLDTKEVGLELETTSIGAIKQEVRLQESVSLKAMYASPSTDAKVNHHQSGSSSSVITCSLR